MTSTTLALALIENKFIALTKWQIGEMTRLLKGSIEK
jgi:hypothetical protein